MTIHLSSDAQGTSDYNNRLGDAVIKVWRKGLERRLGCACYDVSYRLVRRATLLVGDAKPLPAWSNHKTFCIAWGSLGANRKFAGIDEVYRGRGAPGAMFGDNRADKLLEADEIFAGGLRPGAVIQTFKSIAGYADAVNGKMAFGHSFIFRDYVREGSGIVGMKVIDNGYHGEETVKRGQWGYWVGANIRIQNGPSYLPED